MRRSLLFDSIPFDTCQDLAHLLLAAYRSEEINMNNTIRFAAFALCIAAIPNTLTTPLANAIAAA